ncbi:MAG: tetratricopeptide repeat protein [Candidatus Omnitrophica bacterium]|nr:tetratricopeptide repeat protein [Candidatus Omnitrophota bacterium]
MSKSLQKIKKEFFKITNIIPFHNTNYVARREIRIDKIFDSLAERIFDSPKLLDILAKRLNRWLREEKSEFTYSLAGYIFYLKGDFKRAIDFFLKTVEKNPVNLDNWFDLAFSLYHTDNYKLALKILFNFDLFILSYREGSYNKCKIEVLKEITESIA